MGLPPEYGGATQRALLASRASGSRRRPARRSPYVGIAAHETTHDLLEHAQQPIQRLEIELATDLLQIAPEIGLERAQSCGMHGDLFMPRNQPRGALAYYKSHLRLAKPAPRSNCRIAKFYLALGYPLRAKQAIVQALKIDLEDAEAVQLRKEVVR